jgi:hypothetical protein
MLFAVARCRYAGMSSEFGSQRTCACFTCLQVAGAAASLGGASKGVAQRRWYAGNAGEQITSGRCLLALPWLCCWCGGVPCAPLYAAGTEIEQTGFIVRQGLTLAVKDTTNLQSPIPRTCVL